MSPENIYSVIIKNFFECLRICKYVRLIAFCLLFGCFQQIQLAFTDSGNIQNCGDSPQNIQSPISYKNFTLTAEFSAVTWTKLIKINSGRVKLQGQFGNFIYQGKAFKSKNK